MRALHTVLGSGLLLLSWSAGPANIQPLQLGQAERTRIETAACRDPHQVAAARIDAQAYGTGAAAAAVAEVHCASHARFLDSPVHYVVQCFRESGQWDCPNEWSEVAVSMGDETVAVRVEGDISLSQSSQLVHAIADGGMFQGYPLRKALVSPCYVHRGQAKEFIDVRCQGWHIVMSTWCPQSQCPRVFSLTRIGD